MPRAMDDLAGNTYPEIIWQDFMTKIHIGLPSLEFEPYEKKAAVKEVLLQTRAKK